MSNEINILETLSARINKDFEDFVYIVSHDLKAPVRAISNLSVWIEEDLGDNIPAEVRQNIGLLRNRTERLERMINALLQISRVTRRDLDVKSVDLRECLAELAKFWQTDRVIIELPAQLPVILAYYKKFHQVFEQLIQNAITYSDKEIVKIKILAEDSPDFIWFTVQDNGPGIQAPYTNEIFNMFYTGRSKDTDEAMGAGLTLVKQIMSFLGGSIALIPASAGCSFLVGWPKKLTQNT